MVWKSRLVVAFGPLNKVEIGAYDISPSMVVGLWVPPGADQADYLACGVERSIPQADQSWKITEAIAIDQTPYSGSIYREPAGTDGQSLPRALKMHWRLADGDFHSFAIEYADAIYATFSFEPEKPHGIAVYIPASSGPWPGYSLSLGENALTAETLVRL